jgi:hypothetical protein
MGAAMRWGLGIALITTLLGAAPVPPDVAILSASQIAPMLHQCSREAPKPGEGAWQPNAQDIAALEAALPAALGAMKAKGVPVRTILLGGFRRQYVGIVRGGRRYLYGNFFPAEAGGSDRWRREAVIVCDGGPAFFGAEYDVAGHAFTQIGFNGPYLRPR